MGIEEFLDAFAPAEMERMKEADPKKDYDKNMALQKTIEGAKVLKQIKSQTSPLKNRSPQHWYSIWYLLRSKSDIFNERPDACEGSNRDCKGYS